MVLCPCESQLVSNLRGGSDVEKTFFHSGVRNACHRSLQTLLVFCHYPYEDW